MEADKTRQSGAIGYGSNGFASDWVQFFYQVVKGRCEPSLVKTSEGSLAAQHTLPFCKLLGANEDVNILICFLFTY